MVDKGHPLSNILRPGAYSIETACQDIHRSALGSEKISRHVKNILRWFSVVRKHASGDRSITLTNPSISRSVQPEIVRLCQEVWRLMDSIGWPTSLPGYPQLYGHLRLIGFNYRSAKITLAIQRYS